MQVSDVMVRDALYVNHDDTISKALELMGRNCVHQVAVLEDGLFMGMVALKDILNSTYAPTDPVSYVMKKVPRLDEGDSLDDAISKLLKTGYRALPVVDGNSLKGIVSEMDLIKHIEFLADIEAENFSTDVATVREDDGVNKALSIMRQQNISKVVVVDKNGVKGCIDSLSLAGLLSKPSESVRSSPYTALERGSLENFMVRDFTRQTCVMKKDEFSLKEAIRQLQNSEEIVLTGRKGLYGIITPKDVLELRDYEELPLQVANAASIPKLDASRINDKLAGFVKKLQKMADVQKMFVYFDTIRQNGKNHYFARARLVVRNKIFITQSDAWSIDAVVQTMIGNLERQFKKFHDRRIKGKRSAHRKIKEK